MKLKRNLLLTCIAFLTVLSTGTSQEIKKDSVLAQVPVKEAPKEGP